MKRVRQALRSGMTVAAMMMAGAACAQMDLGPKVEKTYGIGLPRDHASQLFKEIGRAHV